jgi:hypothetical protein
MQACLEVEEVNTSIKSKIKKYYIGTADPLIRIGVKRPRERYTCYHCTQR